MLSIERDEAQWAVLEVSISQKTNDACVDELRDEDKLAKLIIFFTNVHPFWPPSSSKIDQKSTKNGLQTTSFFQPLFLAQFFTDLLCSAQVFPIFDF